LIPPHRLSRPKDSAQVVVKASYYRQFAMMSIVTADSAVQNLVSEKDTMRWAFPKRTRFARPCTTMFSISAITVSFDRAINGACCATKSSEVRAIPVCKGSVSEFELTAVFVSSGAKSSSKSRKGKGQSIPHDLQWRKVSYPVRQ
jgi:hypothetical protein